jgi:hypothetical protein
MTNYITDAPDSVYLQSWTVLAIVFVYYLLATVIVQWTRKPTIEMTRYYPPEGISPGLAGYLYENGRSERAFAAAVISLIAKRYFDVEKTRDWFTFKRLHAPDVSAAPEESAILSEIFFGERNVYEAASRKHSRIFLAFRKFEKVVQEQALPSLISSHRVIWGIGVVCLAFIAERLASFVPVYVRKTRGEGDEFALFALIGGFCLFGALGAWVATLRRLATHLPNNKGPARPLGWTDLFPVLLTIGAVVAFGLLAALTSVRYAAFVLGCALLASTFNHLLKAPTAKGRKLLRELTGFREFLIRAESDRLARIHEADSTPGSLDLNVAYAVSLDVERGWGEQFAEDLVEMMQFDEAVAIKGAPARDGDIVQDEVNNLAVDPDDDGSILHLRVPVKK